MKKAYIGTACCHNQFMEMHICIIKYVPIKHIIMIYYLRSILIYFYNNKVAYDVFKRFDRYNKDICPLF